LSASSEYAKYVQKSGCRDALLHIDLKPALSFEQLDNRVLRDFDNAKNKDFRNVLGGLLPSSLIPVIIKRCGISPDRKVHDITKEERLIFVRCIKDLVMHITGTRGYNEAIITQGGVSVKEIDPSTMESKIISGLFVAGELLDIDAYTGGFNLQIAWSTGYAAGTVQ
jgi:predicted Rossmann fold flavoprotein